MALSDDIKQLVRREQDIQGVIGVLDTYLTDRQKRRDDYKPIKADKPKVVKITEINEAGDEITRFVPESQAVSKKEGYVTKKAEENQVKQPKTSDLLYFDVNPGQDIQFDKDTVYKAGSTVVVPSWTATDLQDQGLGKINLSKTITKVDKPKEKGDLKGIDLKQFNRMEDLEKVINKKLGVRIDFSGNPSDIYTKFIDPDRYGSKIEEDRIKVKGHETMTDVEKDTYAYEWILKNIVFKGRQNDYDFYRAAKNKFADIYKIEEEPKGDGDNSDTSTSGSTFQWEDEGSMNTSNVKYINGRPYPITNRGVIDFDAMTDDQKSQLARDSMINK